MWAQAIDVGSINGILEYYQCPPGYCQCTRVDNGSNVCNSVYYYDNDDLQCVCDRKGLSISLIVSCVFWCDKYVLQGVHNKSH